MDKIEEENSNKINQLFIVLALQTEELVKDVLALGTEKDKDDLRKIFQNGIEKLDKGLMK